MSNENKVLTLPQKGIMSLVDANHLSAVESALAMNDLSKLTTQQRISYYNAVCESVGLNPLTQPFAYIVLDGRLTLYARKECSEQLRKINSVSTQIIEKVESEDFFEVHVRAGDRAGRFEEDFASVYLFDKYGKKLSGTNLANAKMKCVTKAKRRVTLAISGLGVIDESELDSIDPSKIQVAENPQIPKPFESVERPVNSEAELEAQPQPELKAEEKPVQDFDGFVISFGKKMMGKKLADFSVKDHEGMVKYLEEYSAKTGKPIDGPALEYYNIVRDYISSGV